MDGSNYQHYLHIARVWARKRPKIGDLLLRANLDWLALLSSISHVILVVY